MLAKHPILNLAKYDLKYIIRGSGVFTAFLLASAILFNLTNSSSIPIIQFIHTFLYNALTCLIISLVLNCMMRLWHRFRYSCYGDMGYLTHTLPLSTKQLWAAKFLVVLGSVLFVFCSIALTFAVLAFTEAGRQLIEIFGLGTNTESPYALALGFTIIAQIIFIIMCGISGIIIGQRTKNHHGLWVVLSGIAIYFAGACIVFGCAAILSIFDPEIASLFSDYTANPQLVPDFNFITKLLVYCGTLYYLLNAALYVVNYKLLQRGVNLE